MFGYVVPDDGGLDGAVTALTTVVDGDHVLIHIVDLNRLCDVVYVVNRVVGWVDVVNDVVALA